MSLLTTLVARLLFALPISVFGLFHFLSAQTMVGMVPSWLPGGIVWVYLTGACLIVAGVSITIGKWVALSGRLLALLLGLFVLFVHFPALFEGHQFSMVAILKDVAIAGGALGFSGTIDED